MEVVVARYNENITWVNKIKNAKITIYNKGTHLPPEYNEIILPNIGRESHTYLTHVINNYDNLADITVFTQGDPFFHAPKFLELLKYSEQFEPVQPLTAYCYPPLKNASKEDLENLKKSIPPPMGVPPYRVTQLDKKHWINNIQIYVEYYNEESITVYPAHYNDHFMIGFLKEFKINCNYTTSYLEYIKQLFNFDNITPNILVPMSYAAIFSVKKEAILSRTKDFYKHLLNILLTYTDKIKQDMGILLERLWLTIFNYQKFNKHYMVLNSKDYNIEYEKYRVLKNKKSFELKIIEPLVVYCVIDKITYMIMMGEKRCWFKLKNKNLKFVKLDICHYDKSFTITFAINQSNYFELIINNKKIIYCHINHSHLNIKHSQLEKIKFDKSTIHKIKQI
jgi:hypothetical protein